MPVGQPPQALSIPWACEEWKEKGRSKEDETDRWQKKSEEIDKQMQGHVRVENKDTDLSTQEELRVWNFIFCCLFSVAVRWNSLSYQQSAPLPPYTHRGPYCLQKNLLTLQSLIF